MGTIFEKRFLGWQPDADSVNAPEGALLRMDNCVLDEDGVVSLRPGTSKVTASALAGEVKTIFSGKSGTNNVRFALGGGTVYVSTNGGAFTSIATGFTAASGVSFIQWLGQTFFGWTTVKKKWDGTTRDWGIPKPTAVLPNLQIDPPAIDCGNFVIGGVQPNPVVGEGTEGIAATGRNGLESHRTFTPDASTGKAVITQGTIASPLGINADFYPDNGASGTDNDMFELDCRILADTVINRLEVYVDIGNGSFTSDFYYFTITGTEDLPLVSDSPFFAGSPELEDFDRDSATAAIGEATSRFFRFRKGPELATSSFEEQWQKLYLRRGQFKRYGNTPGLDWTTVNAVRVVFYGTGELAVANLFVRGGDLTGLSGGYQWKAALAYDFGEYVAMSELSNPSIQRTLENGEIIVDVSHPSVENGTEVWLYRAGGTLNAYYRVATAPATGLSTSIRDGLSDQDALIIGIRSDPNLREPPDNVVDLEGPHYGRIYMLTQTTLHPSKRLNPEGFDVRHGIRVADAGETALWVKKALGGLYVGTTKDLYRLDGFGEEFPDGTIGFRLTPLNVGRPPVGSNAVAQLGNFLVYRASDGWRQFNGVQAQPLAGATSLLWRGFSRHGVSAVNTADNTRIFGAFGKAVFVSMIPEGGDIGATTKLWKYHTEDQRWYRHTYPFSWRSVHAEADGTILVGDLAGNIYQVDDASMTTDNGTAIAVDLIWGRRDGGQPNQEKEPWDLRVKMATGGSSMQVSLYNDNADAITTGATFTTLMTNTGLSSQTVDISSVAPFKQTQLRILGSTALFRLMEWSLQFKDRPSEDVYKEQKPVSVSPVRRRFGGLTVVINGTATVTAVLDGADQVPTFPVNSAEPDTQSLTIDAVVGYDLWGKLAGSFELYDLQPIVLEKYPPRFKGRTPSTNLGHDGTKVASAIAIKACTLGAQRSFQFYLDGVLDPTVFTLTSGADEPTTDTFVFASTKEFADIALTVDGDIELWEWKPDVLYSLPAPRRVWDTGPIDINGTQDLTWVREVKIKVRANADLNITPYFDDVAFSAFTKQVGSDIGKTTTFSIPVGREYRGRCPRVSVTSGQEFLPYWIEMYFRGSGTTGEKQRVRIGG